MAKTHRLLTAEVVLDELNLEDDYMMTLMSL